MQGCYWHVATTGGLEPFFRTLPAGAGPDALFLRAVRSRSQLRAAALAREDHPPSAPAHYRAAPPPRKMRRTRLRCGVATTLREEDRWQPAFEPAIATDRRAPPLLDHLVLPFSGRACAARPALRSRSTPGPPGSLP